MGMSTTVHPAVADPDKTSRKTTAMFPNNKENINRNGSNKKKEPKKQSRSNQTWVEHLDQLKKNEEKNGTSRNSSGNSRKHVNILMIIGGVVTFVLCTIGRC